MKSIPRIALAFAALQLLVAPAPVAFGAGRAAGDGSPSMTGTAPASQTRGRRGGRRRTPDALLPGVWGGRHVRFEVTKGGATVEFDCAHATVEGRIAVDRAGRFGVAGTFYAEHGGPVRDDEAAAGQPVRLTGRVGGSLMSLTIAGAGNAGGTFTLNRGREAALVKCR